MEIRTECQPASFYESFDRQLRTFISMSLVLIEGWEDYGTIDLTCDLRSLNAKAARLCYMTSQDAVYQQEDLKRQRNVANSQWMTALQELVHGKLSQHFFRVMGNTKNGVPVEGHKSPQISGKLSEILPLLKEPLAAEGTDPKKLEELKENVLLIEKKLEKKGTTAFPGMKNEERLMLFIRFYAMACCVMFHFERMNSLYQQEITPEEAERIFCQNLMQYRNSEVGKAELKRYETALIFDNGNQSLTLSQLQSARIALRKELPNHLQSCFMEHADDTHALVPELLKTLTSAEEYQLFLEVMAKWQLLGNQLHEIQYPEDIKPPFYNQVFCTMVGGSRVQFPYLKKVIGRMVEKITKKNQWFCVWCVLKHRNLLENLEFEAFARQMMHPDWFGDVPERIQFKGDNLTEYSGYLANIDYESWDEKTFKYERSTNHKTKWSEDLVKNFKPLCRTFNAEFYW